MIEIHPGAPGPDEDTVAARHYAHAALPGRTVVRLVTATLAEAEDLALEYLGFAAPDTVTTVGAGRRETIGFPAWALLNDPANGRHALNLVKEMTRLARVARTKPGNARTEFVAIGERLGSSVPHFLPTYYEEAGRIFLEQDNTAFAGAMFTKAREAEHVHALTVDPVRLRTVFVEFSLAGAVSTKLMSEHSRWLADHHPATEAYELFWGLCVERIRGGLPPYSGMAKDIHRLANAAGLAAQDVDDALLREVLAAHAAEAASKGFWQAHRTALVSLANRDPAVRDRLLEIVPTAEGAAELWLEVLIACDAITSSPAPARWLGGFVDHLNVRKGWYLVPAAYQHVRMRELITDLADRLKADGVPVDLQGTNEPDLFDLFLSLGVPLGQIPESLDLAEDPDRDLVALAADERFREVLFDALDNEILDGNKSGARKAITRLERIPGVRSLLPAWFERRADRILTADLPRLDRRLAKANPLRTAEAWAYAPEAAQRIGDLDVVPLLAETLRTGLFDELGWRALDEAVAKLAAGSNVHPGSMTIGESWPALILHGGNTVIVVGTDEILYEHTLRIPAQYARGADDWIRAFYVAGHLLVCWGDKKGDWHGYWSNDPAKVFTPTNVNSYGAVQPSLPMPDGGRHVGGGVLHVGDTRVPDRKAVHSDGTRYWYEESEWDYESQDMRVTWHPAELPHWLEHASVKHSHLRPGAQGVHGWRATRQPDGSWLGESVDGTRIRLNDGIHVPLAAVRFPGGETPVAVAYCGNDHELFTEDGRMVTEVATRRSRPPLARGTVLTPHLPWWTNFRPRDEQGSKALRAVTEETARALLTAENLPEAVRTHLPEITHPELVKGLTGVVEHAAALARKLKAYHDLAVTTPEPLAFTTLPDDPDDGILRAALDGRWTHQPDATTVLPQIRQLAALTGESRTKGLPREDFWLSYLPHVGLTMLRAASQVTPEPQRKALTALLTALVDTGLTGTANTWHKADVTIPKKDPLNRYGILTTAESLVVFLAREDQKDYSYEGKPRIAHWKALIKGPVPSNDQTSPWRITKHKDLTGLSKPKLAAFLNALNNNGPLVLEGAGELAAKTGMPLPAAKLLLAGAPDAGTYGDSLDLDVRKALGLSAAQGSLAKRALAGVNLKKLLHVAIPEHPEDLWTAGPDIDAVATRWNRKVGRVNPVDEDVLVDATKAFPHVHDLIHAVNAITTKEIWERKYRETTAEDIVTVLDLLGWLAYRLPANDPVRDRLPVVLDEVRAKVTAPDVVFSMSTCCEPEKLTQLLAVPQDEKVVVDDVLELRRDTYWGDKFYYQTYLHPGKYAPRHRNMLNAVMELSEAEEFDLTTLLRFQDKVFEDVCAQRADAGYLQDPTVTVPDLVTETAGKYGVDEDTAVLYLQILALDDPTDTNVARWLAWKPARLRKARAALAGTDLVITAKRSRAGRTLFLPGGWRDAKSPALPRETWKDDLPDGTVEQRFRQAWGRVEQGDVPGYEELRT